MLETWYEQPQGLFYYTSLTSISQGNENYILTLYNRWTGFGKGVLI